MARGLAAPSTLFPSGEALEAAFKDVLAGDASGERQAGPGHRGETPVRARLLCQGHGSRLLLPWAASPASRQRPPTGQLSQHHPERRAALGLRSPCHRGHVREGWSRHRRPGACGNPGLPQPERAAGLGGDPRLRGARAAGEVGQCPPPGRGATGTAEGDHRHGTRSVPSRAQGSADLRSQWAAGSGSGAREA